jgi:hypothetical protein
VLYADAFRSHYRRLGLSPRQAKPAMSWAAEEGAQAHRQHNGAGPASRELALTLTSSRRSAASRAARRLKTTTPSGSCFATPTGQLLPPRWMRSAGTPAHQEGRGISDRSLAGPRARI